MDQVETPMVATRDPVNGEGGVSLGSVSQSWTKVQPTY